MSQKCEQLSYEQLFWDLGVWGGLNGPHPHLHPQRQYQSSLPGENKYVKNICLAIVYEFFEEIE